MIKEFSFVTDGQRSLQLRPKPGAIKSLEMHKQVAWKWLFLLGPLLGGCTNTIIPPKTVQQPATVYLLDHGRHPSLVVPADSGLMRYSYGEWNWYAMENTGVLQAFSALFLPTPATLGAKYMANDAEYQRMLQIDPPVHVYPIRVDQAKVAELRQRLDSVLARDDKHHYNRTIDLDFVHYPRCYTLFHNSNHETADWLRELGCKVRGCAMFSEWKVREP